MSSFSAPTGTQLIKVLRKLGFDLVRTKGSHHFLRHAHPLTHCVKGSESALATLMRETVDRPCIDYS